MAKDADRPEYHRNSCTRKGVHMPLYLWEPIFKENFWISYAISKEEFLKSAKENDVRNVSFSDSAYGKTFCLHKHKDKDATIKWIWVERHDVPALAHECIHAVTDLLVDRGLELDFNSSEAYAYMVEWLMRETLEDYTRRRKVEAKRKTNKNTTKEK